MILLRYTNSIIQMSNLNTRQHEGCCVASHTTYVLHTMYTCNVTTVNYKR